MINIRTIRRLADNDGLTLKHGKRVTYRTGWQVATTGIECRTAAECMAAVKYFGGDCGVWFFGGVYYVDKSHRVNTKREAMEIGKACAQLTVLRWRDMAVVAVA